MEANASGSFEELGITVFHEAKSYDEAQWNRSPGGRFHPVEHDNDITNLTFFFDPVQPF
jgi:hypothetical protein